MDGGAGVIALGHHDDVVAFHRHGFIELAVIGVNALKGKALGRVEAVVVGFFQQRLMGRLFLSCL